MDTDQPAADRLAHLEFLERVQLQELARTRRWIEDEKRRRAARRAPATWLLELGPTGRAAVHVHTGGCHSAGTRTRSITADEARDALRHGPVPACTHCRPDTALT
ncbi:DUF6233 domain-containing protein [Streptomyces sp. NPDC050264]|uniref:DUF6233 domain-containing protein n=1 Tax=Streptomyces sp. NPDC050264 TaxID=3155038 RepID=UPI003448CB44